MADLVFNIAKGKVAQYVQNVEDNSPAAAVLRMYAIVTSDTDDAIRDADSVSAVLALGSTAEATNTGYTAGGLTMDETDITITVDDTNNRVDIDLIDQTFTSISAGDNWTDLVIAYDPDGTNTTANNIPLTLHDFVVTPNGGDITAQIAAAGFFRAS